MWQTIREKKPWYYCFAGAWFAHNETSSACDDCVNSSLQG